MAYETKVLLMALAQMANVEGRILKSWDEAKAEFEKSLKI